MQSYLGRSGAPDVYLRRAAQSHQRLVVANARDDIRDPERSARVLSSIERPRSRRTVSSMVPVSL
jgi:hypothetical protein